MTKKIKSAPEGLRNLDNIIRNRRRTLLKPSPRLVLSEWCNANRYLSRESSPEPGLYRWQRAPYVKEILDVCGSQDTERVVIMTSAQISKTTIQENVLAYYMANDPAPILFVLPELSTAKAISTTRIDPMIRDTPVLRNTVKAKRNRDSGNTMLEKRFVGGQLTLIGANSPSGLRSKPIRVLLLDEVSSFPISAGKEGDPVELAIARTSNFWNRKIILTSTPTEKGICRIEKEWDTSDKREFFLPCPHCQEKDRLTWERMKWENHDPQTAYIVCLKCGCQIDEEHKPWMLKHGEWRKGNPASKIAGFHLNALYSPWARWSELVTKWYSMYKDHESRKVFQNTILGLPFEEDGERVDAYGLASRLDKTWTAGTVPQGTALLVCALDVNSAMGGWIEGHVWAIAPGEHWSWIDRIMIEQDPGTDAAWHSLTVALANRTYKTPKGADLGIRAYAIDTGHMSEQVFRYVKERRSHGWHIIPVKGSTLPDFPVVRKREKVYSVGNHVAKDIILARLKSGQIHFPEHVPIEVLQQMTAEKRFTRYTKGRAYHSWENPQRNRTEALDCLVYSMAVLQTLGAHILPYLGKLAEKVEEREPVSPDSGEQVEESKSEVLPQAPQGELKPAIQAVQRRRREALRSNRQRFNWSGGGGY